MTPRDPGPWCSRCAEYRVQTAGATCPICLDDLRRTK